MINTTVGTNPEKVINSRDLERIIKNIIQFQREFKCRAGVGELQNLSLGSCYLITSARRAYSDIKKPGRKSEFYIEFYPRSYFEEKLRGLSL